MKKLFAAILLVSCLCIITLVGLSMLRKDLPYDIEVVAQCDSIALINKTDWTKRDLIVHCRSESGESGEKILSGNTKKRAIRFALVTTIYRIWVWRIAPRQFLSSRSALLHGFRCPRC